MCSAVVRSLQVVRNALPASLATQLLDDLLRRSERYVRGQWFMFGQRHDAPRTSAYFNLREAEVRHCSGRGAMPTAGACMLLSRLRHCFKQDVPECPSLLLLLMSCAVR